ncbi:hypothetical protein KFE25_005148 [Diacronema lutheri]|uniref:Histidine phosphatase family protein n=2 Tax=Diacronema lutheri TaxID=2081491 RepID=A0A8J6C4G7_DIALT|nr:hypothetical protein KFE25_005148 [Diacronema lutheri]
MSPAPSSRERTRKLVWFVRHGEATHNVSHDSTTRDPGLTPAGYTQAVQLDASGALRLGAQLVAASPMRRTLETAQLAVPAQLGVPRIATHLLQEIGTSNADTGRPPAELRAEFGDAFDLSELEEMWYVKPAPWCKQRRIGLDDGQRALAARMADFVRWLGARAEERVIVVTHHGFLCHLLGIELANCEVAAMELTPTLEWAVQPTALVRHLPIVGIDRVPMRHKGSAPLRASRETIAKHYGAYVLAASERAVSPHSARGSWALVRRRLLVLQAAAIAGIVTLALARLERLLRK